MLPKLVGVVNLTPDSFSDGGQFFDTESACQHAEKLLDDGADIVEFGAESSRPGANAISLAEETKRLIPVLNKFGRKRGLSNVCVDTRKPELMINASQMGVGYINNIDGLAPPDVLQQISKIESVKYIAMHKHGSPEDMQKFPMDSPEDVEQVIMEMRSYIEKLREAGFSEDRVFVDPGVGFGKTDLVNLRLLKRISELSTQMPLMVGVSRKSMIGRLCEIESSSDRDPASKAFEINLLMSGVQLVRTHVIGELPLARKLIFGDTSA